MRERDGRVSGCQRAEQRVGLMWLTALDGMIGGANITVICNVMCNCIEAFREYSGAPF